MSDPQPPTMDGTPLKRQRHHEVLTLLNSRRCEYHGKVHHVSRFDDEAPSCSLAMKRVAEGRPKSDPKKGFRGGRNRGPRFYRLTKPTQTGMDTETFRGQLKVICTPYASFEPTGHIEDLLRWIMDNGAEVIWFWNLRFDSDVILRLIFDAVDIMNDKEAKDLFLRKHQVIVGRYTVTLIGAKSFRVEEDTGGHGGPQVNCFDACAFYTEEEVRQPLDTVARVMLGEGKIAEQLGINRRMIGTVEGYYEEHRDEIIQYCKQDSNVTMQLGMLLVDTAYEALGIYPKRWSSAASMAKAWLEKNHPEIMTRSKKHDRFFRDSFRGGLFVTRVLGRVVKQTEADITNAYGTALTKLVSLEGLEVKHSDSGTRSSDAVYGSYIIDIAYDGLLPWRLSDLGVRTAKKEDKEKPDEKILYPTSNPDQLNAYCATKSELDYFDEEGIVYKILWCDELCGTPKGLALPDFKLLVDKVVALKKQAETDPKAKMLRECFKRVINSAYGSLAESRHGETPLTTWPLAAEITAFCRIKIWREWRKIEKTGGTVVSINTDSLRYVPGTYKVPVAKGTLGAFDDKFVDHTVTHYQSGIAMIEHPIDCDCKKERIPKQDKDWTPKRVERYHKSIARIVRVDDIGKNPQFAFEGETDAEIVRRVRHPPHPWEKHGLELHLPECECKRCARVSLRKRGMPSVTAVDLLKARGTEIEVISERPIHAIEGIIQNRMSDVADIPETEDDIDKDDGTRRRSLSLLSNLKTAVYDPAELTFQRLNSGPVVGLPIPMDALLDFTWIKDAIGQRRQIEEMNDYEDDIPGQTGR